MAAPTFVAVGTQAQAAGSISVPWPAGHQADDIGILFLETAGETPATPAGWTHVVGNNTGTPGADAATGLAVYWKRATSAAEANASVSDAGDHVRGKIHVFRGCETSASPIAANVASNVAATASTAVTLPGIVTTVADTYVIQAFSNAVDSTANQTVANDWDNASLTGFARLSTGNHATGNGGGFDVGGGVKETPGTVSDTTSVVLSTASAQVRITIGLVPPAGGGGGGTATTEGGLYVITGVKVTAGAFGATSATLDASSAQARVMIALKPPAAPPVNLPPVITAIPNVVGAVGRELSFNVIITDPEEDALTVTLEAGDTDVPSGAVVNSNVDGTYDFNWTPTSDQVGEWNIKVRAVDPTPNTTDMAFSVTVASEPDPGLLDVARGIAVRAQTDLDSAQALADLLEEHEQMNAQVLHVVRGLIADLQASKEYMDSVIEDLEDGETEN